MKSYITPHTIANNVRMHRTQFSGSYLIVEGDKDARVYKNYTDTAKCHVVIAIGKENAVGALNILEQDSFDGVLAIADADFDFLEKKIYSSRNLILTNNHDLE